MHPLVYREDEILREHDYATPHVAAGYRLHGGFDHHGRDLSPRSAVRPDIRQACLALEASQEEAADPAPASP